MLSLALGVVLVAVVAVGLHVLTWRALRAARLRQKRSDVRGKEVLITGAAHGIGKCLAKDFGSMGCNVILCESA